MLTFLAALLVTAPVVDGAAIPLSGTAPFQIYDGHGGLSAGASSRLLLDYAEPYRSDILDYLYKPGFGANLHTCKIEVGGDTQSTDGTEASFRHYREEAPACGVERGYETWLVSEAYKRNKNIASYILSWGVPAWVGNGSYFSQENIDYQVGYAKCISQALDSTAHPSYIGIWNERSWGSVEYVVSLRNALDAAGFTNTKIIVPDGGDCKGVTAAAAANASYAKAVYALGEHYPCKNACPATAAVGLKFWASEDYSTVADWAGAGCWGRSLNQNFVLLNSTSTIAWSTIWSVYPKDIYFGNGLMYAMSPWSGHYEVNPSIWTSAHHCQFMEIGWHLLQGNSSGMLPGGGSYVTALSPTGSDFTLVLETLQGNCLRCRTGATAAQDLVFSLQGATGLPAPGATLKVWQTTQAAPFVPLGDVVVGADGTLAISIPADAMITLTTITTGGHGQAATPIPPDAPFPLPYSDDFSAYPEDHLPKFFADQGGSWAVRGGALHQVVPADPGPNSWSGNREPYSLLGDSTWDDVEVSAQAVFSAAPPIGAPASAMRAAGVVGGGQGEAAEVLPCASSPSPMAPFQQWTFSAVAPGYLSNSGGGTGSSTTCLNVPGCNTALPLIYYDCVTTGCECGCPSFTNLQFALGGDGALTTPLQSGLCVTVQSGGGGLVLAKCGSPTPGLGQVWAHNGTSGALVITNPPPSPLSSSHALARRNRNRNRNLRKGGEEMEEERLEEEAGPLCLTAPAPPPPPAAWVGLTVRAPPYPNHASGNYNGYTLKLQDSGVWEVLTGQRTAIGNGTLGGGGFNSTQPHTLTLGMVGQVLTAKVDGAAVWSGSDGTYTSGQVAIGSGYHFASFDNFSVKRSQ